MFNAASLGIIISTAAGTIQQINPSAYHFEEIEFLNAIERRLKKHELLRQSFTQDVDGITRFLQETNCLVALENLCTKTHDSL